MKTSAHHTIPQHLALSKRGHVNAELPLWQRITKDLQQRISAGEFSEQFPGELALAEHYDVSRGTIRKVLRPLRETGQIQASRGKKPRIVNTKSTSSFGGIYSLYEEVRQSGASQRSEVIVQRAIQHERVAELLQVAADEDLFYLERRRYADDHVIAWDRLWMPLERVQPLLEVDFTDTAVYKELDERCGLRINCGQEQVWAVAADTTMATRLDTDPGSILFHMQRVSCIDQEPLEVRETVVLAEHFSIVRDFGQSGAGTNLCTGPQQATPVQL